MNEHRFVVSHAEDTFQVGRLDDQPFSGVYLSPAYLDRLRAVLYAASLRLQEEGFESIPDAIKNVVGIARRLTEVHSTQLHAEGYPWTDADRANRADAERRLAEAFDALRRFDPDHDPDPSDPR